MNTEQKQVLLETLRGVQTIFTEPEQWTQWSSAKTARGEKVISSHQDAVCWCLSGALTVACPDKHGHLVRILEFVADRVSGEHGVKNPLARIAVWNDRPYRTIGEVQAFVAQIIENAEQVETTDAS